MAYVSSENHSLLKSVYLLKYPYIIDTETKDIGSKKKDAIIYLRKSPKVSPEDTGIWYGFRKQENLKGGGHCCR